MKEIKAIIQPFMLSKVINALKELEGLPGVTVDSDVKGFGKGRAEYAKAKIVEDLVEYAKKVKLYRNRRAGSSGRNGRPDHTG